MSRIEDEVCKRIQERAEVGKSKYGVTMETASLSQLEWLIHAQEEAMDLAVYLQKLIEAEQDRLEMKNIRKDYLKAKLREMEDNE
tara:strand:- start:5009 stop:5263 length:255 start_codon:yes stop_codon:yes gene_type:complete